MNQTPKQNNQKVNKTLYIVTVTLLFAIAVVIAITSAASRREKKPPLTDTSGLSTEESVLAEDTETAPVTTDRSSATKEVNEPSPDETDSSEEKEDPEPVVSIPPMLSLPTVGIMSKKHDTELQVYSATMGDYRVHSGIDIVTEDGAPVYAAAEGTVSQIWDDPLMGRSIAISHSGNCYTVYKNLAKEMVAGIEEGVSVERGQLIASVGGTAMIELAEESHLHFEVTVDGKASNPLDHFDETSLVSLTIDVSFES